MVHDSVPKEWSAETRERSNVTKCRYVYVFLDEMGRHHSQIASSWLQQTRATRTRIMAVEASPYLPKRLDRSMDVQALQPRYYTITLCLFPLPPERSLLLDSEMVLTRNLYDSMLIYSPLPNLPYPHPRHINAAPFLEAINHFPESRDAN